MAMNRLALIFVLAMIARTLHSAPADLIVLKRDFEGAGGRTEELRLTAAHELLEERWNVHAKTIEELSTTVILAKLTKAESDELVAFAAAEVHSLPKYVNDTDKAFVDPTFQVIRVRVGSEELFSGLEFPEETPDTAESRHFQRVWNALRQRLLSYKRS